MYINGRQYTFTIDIGATQSITSSDVAKGKCEVLSNVRLQTAAGESATVHETEAKVTIANISVSHIFIVADIVDEVIIAADFMIAHGQYGVNR